MTKSKWVSFCGWAVVACWGFLLGCFVMFIRNRPGPYPIPPFFWSVAFLLSFPFFFLWLLGSAVHRLRVGSAKIRATALVDAAKQAGITRWPPATTAGPVKPSPPSLEMCGQCKHVPAVVRCVVHGVMLCQTCWAVHEVNVHGKSQAAAGAVGDSFSGGK